MTSSRLLSFWWEVNLHTKVFIIYKCQMPCANRFAHFVRTLKSTSHNRILYMAAHRVSDLGCGAGLGACQFQFIFRKSMFLLRAIG